MFKQMCKNCNEVEISVRKYKLCRKCYIKLYNSKNKDRVKGYQKKYREKSQKTAVSARRKRVTIRNLLNKFGLEILIDINKIRSRPFYNLTDLGKQYGLTRERARQIYKKLFGEDYRPKQSEKTKKVKEECSIGCANDPRHKIANYTEGSAVHTGAIVEKLFVDTARLLGFDVEIPCKKTIDIKVNGYLVEIKSSSTKHFTRKDQKTPLYAYNLTENQKTTCHFIACWHQDLKKFFIIPNKFKSGSVFIPCELPKKTRAKRCRYLEYCNHWAQLEDNITY